MTRLKEKKFEDYLIDNVKKNYINFCIEYEDGKFFSSIVWGAIFLESYLLQLMSSFCIKDTKYDLNGCIDRINQFNKNNSKSEVKLDDDVIKRFHEIRNIRNRVVHNTGWNQISFENDANSIKEHIDVIADRHMTKFGEIKKDGNKDVAQPVIGKIFLSTINPHNKRQRIFIESFISKIENYGYQIVMAKLTEYDKKDPMGKMKKIIASCDAVIVLGLERSHSYYIRDKEGSRDEIEEIHRKHTSGWLHLEAGLAMALEKKIFVLAQKDLWSDGIFDRVWNSYPVIEFEEFDVDSEKVGRFMNYVDEELRSILYK